MTRQAFFVLLVKKKKFYSREKGFDQGFFSYSHFRKITTLLYDYEKYITFLDKSPEKK